MSRAFAEAVAGLSVANTHLSMEDIGNAARRVCKAMSYDYHEIREKVPASLSGAEGSLGRVAIFLDEKRLFYLY